MYGTGSWRIRSRRGLCSLQESIRFRCVTRVWGRFPNVVPASEPALSGMLLSLTQNRRGAHPGNDWYRDVGVSVVTGSTDEKPVFRYPSRFVTEMTLDTRAGLKA